MDNQDNRLIPMSNEKRPPNKVKPLTAKNRAFLQHLADGRPTLESYRLAGYQGESHAAYQLRSDLKTHLQYLLENGGFNREQLGAEIKRLNELPLDPGIRNVNFRQKLDILRLMEKALPKLQATEAKPTITPFIIGINNPESVVIHEAPTQLDSSVGRTDGEDDGVSDLPQVDK